MLQTFRRIALTAAAGLALTTSAHAQDPAPAAKLVLHADRSGPKVNRQIFGQFAEHLGTGIYGGVWVGKGSKIPNTDGYRDDVVAALKAIRVPVIRWPGGCFADEYRWREGVGPVAKRPVKINTHWGGVTEPNTFGTHEFMNFSERVGAEAYVSGNVGSAPPSELAEWVEYMTSPTDSTLAKERWANGRKQPWTLPYVGIGNELWGCGGEMRADYAANVTRRYATFVKAPSNQKIRKIASGANSEDYNWTEVMMRDAAGSIDGIGVHYYTVTGTWREKGSATAFDETEWTRTLSKTLVMDKLITKHAAVMDKYDPDKRVWLAVDEWGTWFDPTPGTNPGFLQQQNSLRDGLVAAINFNIFTAHADRVKMANIAQMANVLQAIILTDGNRMVRTPTYHVFAMYLPWQDAQQIPMELKTDWFARGDQSAPVVSASAVRDAQGKVHIALVNLDPSRSAVVSTSLAGLQATAVSGRILTAGSITAINTFDAPDAVIPRAFDGAVLTNGGLTATLPARSVVVLAVQ